MKQCKRLVSLVLALTLVLGFVPSGLADILPGYTVEAAETVEIKSAEELVAFLADSGNLGNNAKLTADIEIEYLPVMQGRYTGTFDGNGHTITLTGNENGIVLTKPANDPDNPAAQIPENAESWGMFCELSGTVKNLVLVLENELVFSGENGPVIDSFLFDVSDYKSGNADLWPESDFKETTKLVYMGTVAGKVTGGTVSNVALVSAGDATKFIRSALCGPTVYLGGLVGYNDGGTIRECVVDAIQFRSYALSKRTGDMIYEAYTTSLYIGGIVGGNAGTVSDCLAGGQPGQYIMCDSGAGYTITNKVTQYMGGIAGMSSGSVSGCAAFDHGSYAYVDTVDTGSNDRSYWVFNRFYKEKEESGVTYYTNTNRSVGVLNGIVGSGRCENSFAYSLRTANGEDGCTMDDKNLTGAKSALLTENSAWTTDANGYLTLKWMLQTPEVTITMNEGNSDATLSVKMSDSTPEAAKNRESEWDVEISAYLQGQETAPQVTAFNKVEGSASVTSVTVTAARADGGTDYYTGGTYPFSATVNGTNVEQQNVTWQASNPDDADDDSLNNAMSDGTLTIPDDYFGRISIVASAGNVKSTPYTITVNPAKDLKIVNAEGTSQTVTVEQWQKYDFGVTYSSYTDLSGTVSWSVARDDGSIKPGTSVDENGTLTVAGDEPAGTLTVTALIGAAGDSYSSSAAIKVNVAERSRKTETETVEQTKDGETFSCSVTTGDKLTLTVGTSNKPQEDGYTTTGGTPAVTLANEEDALTGTWSTNPSTFTAAKPGTATFTVKRTFTLTETNPAQSGEPDKKEVTWTATVTVTVADPAPAEPAAVSDQRTELEAVGGESQTLHNSSSAYTVVLDHVNAENSRYYLTTSSGVPAKSAISTVIGGNTIDIPLSYSGNVANGSLYLWMYTPSTQDSLGDSNIVGYQLTANGAQPIDGYAWSEGTSGSEGAQKLTCTIAVKNGKLSLEEAGQTDVDTVTITSLKSLFGNYSSFASGEIRVTVTCRDLYGYGGRYYSAVTASNVVGNAAGRPTVNPNGNGILSDYSFTITVPENSTVYYQIYYTAAVTPDQYPTSETGVKYDGTAVKLEAGHAIYTVIAVAYPNTADGRPSEPDIVTYTAANFDAPAPPTLQINGAAFDSGKTYQNGDAFTFDYTANENYTVYYTVNGTDPDPASAAKLVYDPDQPPALDFSTVSEITIKAIVYDESYLVASEVSTYTVRQRATIGTPVPSIESGEIVRTSDVLTFELPESFVEQLTSLGLFSQAEYVAYDADDSNNVLYKYVQEYTKYGGEDPIDGVNYLLVVGSGATALPTIRYLLNDTESALDAVNGRSYQYAVCRVWSTTDEDGVTTWYYRFTNPAEISLSGEPGSSITVRAKAFAPQGTVDYADGSEVTFRYTVRGKVKAPTAIPESGGTVDVGAKIALTCADPGTEIYYTTDGSTEPQVVWVDQTTDGETGGTVAAHWEPANEQTVRYTGNFTVPYEKQSLFVVRAIAVSSTDSLENSDMATFTYQVNELDKASMPTASPETSASDPAGLANGDRITLATEQAGVDIYYTTDGTTPSYEERDAWDAAYAAADADAKGDDDGARWYLDDEGEKIFEPNTRIYSFQQGITMDADSNGQFFVTAVAVSTERNPPQYEPSEVARFIYQLEKAESPVASPETSTSSVSVIEPNTTITLTSGTVGAEIYYTKDTTLPDVTDTEAVKKAYAEWLAGWNAASEKQRGTDARGVRWYSDASGTKQTEPSTIPYDAAEGITMPKTITTFFTLRAVAVVSDGSRANSEVVTISYQLPEKVQAVYASPIGGTAVEYGASVTLSCSTEDAQIFYKVYESEPGEDDVPVVNQDLAYTEPIPITKEVWIRAVATKSGMESNVATYHYTVAPTAAAPTVSLPGGSVVPKGTRITLSGEGTIVYTLDGSDPKADDAAKQYGTVVNLDGEYGSTITLRAYIQRDGYTPSDVVSFTYTICAEEDYLTISVESGSVIESGTSVTLSTAITNGRIFYTLDGSTPQVKNVYAAAAGKDYTTYEWASASSSTIAGSGFTLSGNPDAAVAVRAIVVVNGGEGGQVSTFTYKFQPQAASPTASIPTGAVVFDGAAVTLTAKEGTIYYTLDGKDPTTSSSIYSEPIDVSGSASTVLKAMVVVDGKAASPVVTYRYTRAGQAGTPVFSVTPGEIDTGTTVAITSDTDEAAIYYSTDGTTPTADNLQDLTLYVAPISVTRAVTIKAIAVSDKLDASDVAEATYTVREPAPAPEPQQPDTAVTETVTDRLTSRRTYDSAGDGPKYSGVILRESVCNTVLSAEEGALPDGTVLTVSQETPSKSDEASVNTTLGQTVARVYAASLTLNGDPVTPTGTVELGFAIPAEYQNGIVSVSRINDDGTLTQYTARRSGGIAYIETDTLGRFALSVPQQPDAAGIPTAWLIGGGVLLAIAAGAAVVLLMRRRRRAEEAAAAAEEPQPFEDLAEFQNFHEL